MKLRFPGSFGMMSAKSALLVAALAACTVGAGCATAAPSAKAPAAPSDVVAAMDAELSHAVENDPRTAVATTESIRLPESRTLAGTKDDLVSERPATWGVPAKTAPPSAGAPDQKVPQE